MSIDILSMKDIWKIPKLTEIKCFNEYRSQPEDSISVEGVVKYVVLLYSKDSILNKKPLDDLKDRRIKAAKFADLELSDKTTFMVFDLESDKVRSLILNYLVHQNNSIWAERCVIEAQMEESQKIRMKPVDMDDDKGVMEAFNKKAALTDHYKKWHQTIKEYDSEIFGSVSEDKDRIIRKRTTLESIV